MSVIRKRKILFLVIHLLFFNFSFSQESENFIPSGYFYGTVFSNFHYQLNAANESAFEVQRAYMGYTYHLSSNYSVNIKLDIGSPEHISSYDILKRYAYFKNAELIYNNHKLTIHAGLIDLYQFKVQEKFWGHRYIYKSFQDQHKFGSSADIGASVSYVFNKFIKADFSVMNGEGYNQLQTDNTYKSALGISVTPINKLTIRLYADYIEEDEIQATWSSFIGYQFRDKAKIGVEYNYQSNSGFRKNRNQNGFSGYASVNISKKFELFGRYDKLWSNTLSGDPYNWNITRDGSAIIAGIQYTPIKNINIAANYQDWYPYAKNLENESYFYLNLEFKF
ncbi:MAG: porin [Bacteroidota bacterium]|nr:porin [Bacteroidota bacterium]